jgi:serine phosphatase RsbU (regulator of sigma subunit)
VGMFLLFGMARRRRNAFILGGIALLYLVYLGLWNVLSFIPLSPGPYATLAARFVATLQPARTAEFALIVALFTLLVAQTLDIVRERGAISSEIEAARTMQQLLLTRSSEATPGFTVETAYLPAGEVGGDFFLVSPTRDGSLAAVVGDVSGKGLRAAMQVSMILGVLRREPSRDPATVLCSLNEALLSQQDTGFTTACAVELCADGRYTIANAGHISPYLTGMGRSLELIAPPAFPLGLAGDQSYDVLCGQLKPGQRLVLMSDGIVEARASHGELYGFERLLPLTLRPAAEIASTALAFGQDDDITVVTLSCQFSEAKPAQPAEARTAIQPQPQSQSQPAPKPAPPPSPIHRPTPPPPIP